MNYCLVGRCFLLTFRRYGYAQRLVQLWWFSFLLQKAGLKSRHHFRLLLPLL
jgi:hypothetical protein